MLANETNLDPLRMRIKGQWKMVWKIWSPMSEFIGFQMHNFIIF